MQQHLWDFSMTMKKIDYYPCQHKYCMWNRDFRCVIKRGPDGPMIESYHILPGYCRFVYKVL